MELVVDANVLISALIAVEGKTYDLIYNDKLRLFAPEFLMEEFEKHKKEILEKSGLSGEDFDLFLSLISSRIEFISKDKFEKFIPKAAKVTPDPKDAEYFALAQRLGCAIWSNEKKLKNQDKIKIYNTRELLALKP